MTEPRTAAGRALQGNDIRTPAEGGTSPGYRRLNRAILAIEAEARAAALDEARAAVKAKAQRLTLDPDTRRLDDDPNGDLAGYHAVLAAIDALREDADKPST